MEALESLRKICLLQQINLIRPSLSIAMVSEHLVLFSRKNSVKLLNFVLRQSRTQSCMESQNHLLSLSTKDNTDCYQEPRFTFLSKLNEMRLVTKLQQLQSLLIFCQGRSQDIPECPCIAWYRCGETKFFFCVSEHFIQVYRRKWRSAFGFVCFRQVPE